MRELWRALAARLVYWMTPRVPAPDTPLTDGTCVCSHGRCAHKEGNGRCYGMFGPNTEHNCSDQWLYCGCQIYIPKKDDPSDPPPETPDPSVDELEELFKK